MFTTGENLMKVTEEKGYRTALKDAERYDSGLHFSRDAALTEGEDAGTIKVTFYDGYKSSYLFYHADTGRYTMQQMGGDYVDGNTNELVEYDNVIVFSAESWILDDYGRRSFVLVNASGSGYYANSGKIVPITWTHGGLDEPFHYYLESGEEIELLPGHTYIGILPHRNAGIGWTND